MEAVADTTYLIDLWRESGNGPATRFALANPELAIGLPWVVLGEFLAGTVRAGHDGDMVLAALAPFIWAHSNDSIVSAYARLEADMRARNAWIGSPDTWIAATAVSCAVPLITRNRRHFGRVASLQILDYSAPASG